MKKKSTRELLKGLSWFYIFIAVFVLAFGLIVAFVPEVKDKLIEITGNDNALLEFEIQIGISALFYLCYFWLARRLTSGKSNGTFYMILLVLGVAGGVISFFAGNTKAISSLDFIVDLIALIYVLKIRKENN